MRIVHVTWATLGRQPAFPTEAALIAALHVLGRFAGKQVLLFAIVDDHVHVVLLLLDGELRRLQASLTRVLNRASAVRFAPAYVREVSSRRHMEGLVSYCLTQLPHHGLPGHPATAPGSCFADLVGARRIPGLSLPLGLALPRFQLREAYAAVGLSEPLVPASDALIRALGPAGIARAAAATFAVADDAPENFSPAIAARRAAVVLAAEVGMKPAWLAEPLCISPTAASRLAVRPVDAGSLRAVRLRVSLDAAVQLALRIRPERLSLPAAAPPR